MLDVVLRYLSNAIPDVFISLIALSAGYMVRVFTNKTETTAENIVRGTLLAPRFGASQLTVGRHVIFSGAKNIRFGDKVNIHAGSQLVAGASGSVKIGNNSHIARSSVLAGGGHIEVGDYCMISSGVRIYSATYQRGGNGSLLRDAVTCHKKVTIGNDVHIGANATLLPGVTVGNNATIGAGAVVTKDVSDNSVVVGVPADLI